ADQSVGGLVDRAIATEGHHDVVALRGGLAAELGGVVAGLGVHGVDVVAAAQRVDDEVLQAVRHRRGIRVDDDQHAAAGHVSVLQVQHRLEARQGIGRGRGHGSVVQHTEVGQSLRQAAPIYCPPDIAVRIQRGGGIWPYETPATSRKGTVPNPSGSNYKAWEMWQGGFSDLRPLTPAEVFSYAARVASLQGMPHGLPA